MLGKIKTIEAAKANGPFGLTESIKGIISKYPDDEVEIQYQATDSEHSALVIIRERK